MANRWGADTFRAVVEGLDVELRFDDDQVVGLSVSGGRITSAMLRKVRLDQIRAQRNYEHMQRSGRV